MCVCVCVCVMCVMYACVHSSVCICRCVCLCVQAGPPFACGTYFDGVDDTIDLGTWSPGAVYTLAAWVSPGVTDARRRVGDGRSVSVVTPITVVTLYL